MHQNKILLSLAGLALLSACGGTGTTAREALGLERQAPDEFSVVTRPALSVPPQFNLRSPSVIAAGPGLTAADDKAESLVIGEPTQKPDAPQVFSLREGSAPTAVTSVESVSTQVEADSNAERNFLSQIGVTKADPKVREKLIEEKIQKIHDKEEEGWWDSIGILPEKEDPTVDAQKEKTRILRNKAQGKPVTEGETPEVDGAEPSMFRKIFGDF